ncbi:MAG: BtaA family protein [Gemmataceae bacterium]|nr:BtaA family protein [Gemmataceae bacterium]
MTTAALWLDEASSLPIAFAQVREDALLDLEVLASFGSGARMVMVASGGCTAAALAALRPIASLHLVNPNPAQMALARLKLRLVQTAEPARRLALLGHVRIPADERQRQLVEELQALGLPEDCLGPPALVARLGPDHAGRYERLFVRLRESLDEAAANVEQVLRLTDPVEQARHADPASDFGRALDGAYDAVLALPNLVRLFGEGATRNRVEPFARHFARRTRQVLATLPAAGNPYLWQMLRGSFPPGTVYPWFTAPIPSRMPEVAFTIAPMADALPTLGNSFDVVHLSNILDWLSIDEARRTLELAWNALRPGGVVLIRQLNSSLDIPALGGPFQWQPEVVTMHMHDRSFFYRHFHLGKKR